MDIGDARCWSGGNGLDELGGEGGSINEDMVAESTVDDREREGGVLEIWSGQVEVTSTPCNIFSL